MRKSNKWKYLPAKISTRFLHDSFVKFFPYYCGLITDLICVQTLIKFPLMRV